jgi:hypothetical protein
MFTGTRPGAPMRPETQRERATQAVASLTVFLNSGNRPQFELFGAGRR